MNGFFRALLGSYRVRFVSDCPERILIFTMKQNIPIWGTTRFEGGVFFSIRPWDKGRFRPFSFLEGESVEYQSQGMMHLLCLFYRRFGFFAGAFLLFCSLFLSTQFLWGVEIYGEETLSKKELSRQLSEFGLAVGTPLSRIDAKDLAMRYQISRSDLVYVNINVVGTKAYVEVRERATTEKIAQEEGYSNLVAEIYGKVVRYEVLSGQIEVKKGEDITEGRLLISGVKETKHGTFYPVRAKGRVFAKTVRDFETTVPFEMEEEVFTGREKVKRSLEILGLTLPLPTVGEGSESRCKTMEIKEQITIFGYTLPIVLREVYFLETQVKKEGIKLDRAEELAYDKYEEFKRGTFAEGDEILSENVEITKTENALTLTASIEAVEDICKEQTFLYTSP